MAIKNHSWLTKIKKFTVKFSRAKLLYQKSDLKGKYTTVLAVLERVECWVCYHLAQTGWQLSGSFATIPNAAQDWPGA